MLCLLNLIFVKLVENDSRSLDLHNMKSLQKYHLTLHSHNLILTTFAQLGFMVLHLGNLKSLPETSLCNTLAQLYFTTPVKLDFRV